MNLPNKLTIFRIILIPVFIACFYLPLGEYWRYFAAGVFVFAYLTDIIDGRYARKHELVTDFGKLMDPIADKLLTASALVMLTAFDLMSPIPAIIIIAREFAVSGLRLVAAGKGNVIAASVWGKLKTLSQCIAIVLVLLQTEFFALLHFRIDVVFIWLSAALAVVSGIDFVVKNKDSFELDK